MGAKAAITAQNEQNQGVFIRSFVTVPMMG